MQLNESLLRPICASSIDVRVADAMLPSRRTRRRRAWQVDLEKARVVLTNRRFIIYQPRMLGRVDLSDCVWRDLQDVKLKEGILGATISLLTVSNRALASEHLPKSQARRIYALAREMEERVREERRLREMEERRAGAGGVVIQGGPGGGHGATQSSGEDPVQKLKQLKEMLDAGLVTQGEYEAKRQAILSRMQPDPCGQPSGPNQSSMAAWNQFSQLLTDRLRHETRCIGRTAATPDRSAARTAAVVARRPLGEGSIRASGPSSMTEPGTRHTSSNQPR